MINVYEYDYERQVEESSIWTMLDKFFVFVFNLFLCHINI